MAGHLIHVGYPKAGSTFLQAWFERHPELCYRPGALGGFYNVFELARPSDRAYKFYVTSFEGLSTPGPDAGTLKPDYVRAEQETDDVRRKHQAAVCEVLKSLYPDSRVLIITRGFKGMIVSGYSQYVRTGGRRHLREMCLQITEGRPEGNLHFYDFDHLIRLYREAFGEENLIVLPYELLREDQDRFLAALEERLGLEHTEVRLGRVNPSLSPEELYWYPLISRAVAAAASRLGAAGSKRVFGWYVAGTLNNRFRLLVRVLSRLRPGRKITEADFPPDVLRRFRGRASLLKGDPLFTPYAAEYLWEEERAGS